MKKVLLAISLLVMGFWVACGETKGIREPEWALNTPTESGYMYFVGYAEDLGLPSELRDTALAQAKAKLMSYIFEMSTVQQTFSASGVLNDDSEILQQYEQSIQSESMANLTGISPEEFEYQEIDDAGLTVVHAWVLIKVSESEIEAERTRIIEEIARKLALVDDEIEAAESAIADGRVMDGVNAYLTAALNAVDVEDRASEVMIYINKALDHLDNFQLSASDDNPDTGDTDLETVVKFLLTYYGDDGEIPVSGARVNFTMEDNRGDYTESALTDEDGEVECEITSIDSVGSTKMNAKLSLDISQILDLGDDYYTASSDLQDAIQRASAYASFNVVSEANMNINTTVIGIKYTDTSYKKDSDLTSEAYEYLLDEGYKVSRFPSSVSDYEGVYDLEEAALNSLANQGIERVFILGVEDIDGDWIDSLEVYSANYKIYIKLVETESGEVLTTDSLRINVTDSDENDLYDAFIEKATDKMSRILDF